MSRTKRFLVSVAAGLSLLVVSAATAPRATVVRLATIVPPGSPWHTALQEMKTAWERDSEGRVSLTVYPGGTMGSDAKVVRDMRANAMQSTLMLLSGLSLIDDSFSALSMPFFFDSDAETQAVVTALTPLIESKLSAKGFHLLAWTNGGWVQVLSKKKLTSLADIKAAKLFTSEGDTKMVQWYQENGFHPQAMDSNAMPGALQSGLIDATPVSAYPALLFNLDKVAPFMLDVHVAPLLGAVVINKNVWSAISAADQAKLTEAAKRFETKTSTDMPALDAKSLATLKGRGLTVVPMEKAQSDSLHAEAIKLVTSMRGKMVPEDAFDAALAARDKFRGKKAPGSK